MTGKPDLGIELFAVPESLPPQFKCFWQALMKLGTLTIEKGTPDIIPGEPIRKRETPPDPSGINFITRVGLQIPELTALPTFLSIFKLQAGNPNTIGTFRIDFYPEDSHFRILLDYDGFYHNRYRNFSLTNLPDERLLQGLNRFVSEALNALQNS